MTDSRSFERLGSFEPRGALARREVTAQTLNVPVESGARPEATFLTTQNPIRSDAREATFVRRAGYVSSGAGYSPMEDLAWNKQYAPYGVGEVVRRPVVAFSNLIDNVVVDPLRLALKVGVGGAFVLPAQMLWNGKIIDSEAKSLKNRAMGAFMLLASWATFLPLLAAGFLTQNMMNLPNTLSDSFRTLAFGHSGYRYKMLKGFDI